MSIEKSRIIKVLTLWFVCTIVMGVGLYCLFPAGEMMVVDGSHVNGGKLDDRGLLQVDPGSIATIKIPANYERIQIKIFKNNPLIDRTYIYQGYRAVSVEPSNLETYWLLTMPNDGSDIKIHVKSGSEGRHKNLFEVLARNGEIPWGTYVAVFLLFSIYVAVSFFVFDNCFLSLALFSVVTFLMVCSDLLVSNLQPESLAVAGAFSLSGIIICSLLMKIRFLSIPTLCLTCLLLVLMPALNIVYYVNNKHGIGENQLNAMLQSNFVESLGYVRTYYSLVDYLSVVVVSLLVIVLIVFNRRRKVNAKAIASILFFLFITVQLGFSSDFLPIYSAFTNSVIGYSEEIGKWKKVSAERNENINRIQASKVEKDELYVVVIGESSSKSHYGMYGYYRDTTPSLEKIEGLIKYTDVVSSHTHTELVLPDSLTCSDADNDMTYADAPSIIEIARAAGIETYWLSNQNAYGVWDNKVSVLAHGASNVKFVNSSVGKTVAGAQKDEMLVPLVEEIASRSGNASKLVFVHLMGSHIPYGDRYPAEFHMAGSQRPGNYGAIGRGVNTQSIDEYDSSVRYTDYVLSEIISVVEKAGTVSSVLYFSDHAEDVIGNRGHNSGNFTQEMVEIPMLLWVSPGFLERYPERVGRFAKAAHRPFMNDQVEDFLMDLSGIDTAFFHPEQSIAYGNRVAPNRIVVDGKFDYDDPSVNLLRPVAMLFSQLTEEKVLPHRVNSLGKLSESIRLGAPGVELDLIFRGGEGGYFEVGHDEGALSRVAFEEFLRVIQKNKKEGFRLWLDVKNLNETNRNFVLGRLDDLDRVYRLRGSVLVESSSLKSLSVVTAAGYATSYYLPVAKVLGLKDSREMRTLSDEILANLNRHDVGSISFDVRISQFVGTYLLPRLSKDIDFHVWDLSLNMSERGSFSAVAGKDYYKDERVKTVLLPYSSRFGI